MGLIYVFWAGATIPEDQPSLFICSMIRRTGQELLLRSVCIAIAILVRLQQVNRTLIN